jgi:hypothetical protein
VRRRELGAAQALVGDSVVFTGINTWRGVTKHKPILTGRSYMRVGSIFTGKIVIYPIADDIDGAGNQLINWTTEIKRDTVEMNDWNKPGDLADFISVYESWRFDWLDVAELIRKSEFVLEYPMVDKDPLGGGPSAASRSRATPRIRCIRAARTGPRRR